MLGYTCTGRRGEMRIREHRENARLSRKALGLKIGYAPLTIFRWETGKRIPPADVIPKIAEACGVTIEDLYKE
jgi:transcriptional regulator with XRE-family HTH domain